MERSEEVAATLVAFARGQLQDHGTIEMFEVSAERIEILVHRPHSEHPFIMRVQASAIARGGAEEIRAYLEGRASVVLTEYRRPLSAGFRLYWGDENGRVGVHGRQLDPHPS